MYTGLLILHKRLITVNTLINRIMNTIIRGKQTELFFEINEADLHSVTLTMSPSSGQNQSISDQFLPDAEVSGPVLHWYLKVL